MPVEISNISFQEDYLIWSDVEVDDYTINIKRAVIDSLPISINYATLQQSFSSKQIANHINAISQKYEFKANNIRVTIPGKFVSLKKVRVDENIPAQHYRELVNFEFEKTWNEPREDYQVFLPEYDHSSNGYNEVLGDR